MHSAITRAQPALAFIPPQYSPWLRRAMQPVLPAWVAWQTNLAEIESRNVETLAQLYSDFKKGKTRFLLAFRHPNANDPYVLGQLLWHDLPDTARQMGLALGLPHTHFIYDRGIPLWAGGYLGWVFSRLGGVPIQRGKLDVRALKTARELFLTGRFPMAAAPEGGNNGHNEIISQLEPGIAQLAFWCAEDLKAKARPESVAILPVGIQYRYVRPPWAQLRELITQLETDSGLQPPAAAEAAELRKLCGDGCEGTAKFTAREQAELYGRLYRLAEHLLTLMEGYYREFYGVKFEASAGDFADNSAGARQGPNEQLAKRLHALMHEALQVAESYFKLRPKGSTIDRCRKLEQAGWDRIFREDVMRLSPVEIGLANRIAEEADLRMWHMRLVESFVAVTGNYVKENPSADRFAETTLVMRDMVEKIMGTVGGKRTRRLPLGKQKAIVTVGQPITVDERLADYKQKRRGAIAALTQDLRIAMESLLLPD